MTDIEFINYVNAQIIHESSIVIFLAILALYYFVKEIPTFDVTFLVLTQSAIDTILIPFYATFNLAHIVNYATAAMTAAYVSYRLHKRYLNGDIKITIVEVIVAGMEAFIILSLCVRFIEYALLDSHWLSAIFGYVIDCSNYIILAILLMPFYIKTVDKLGIREFVNVPVLQGKLLRFMYSKVPDSSRRGN